MHATFFFLSATPYFHTASSSSGPECLNSSDFLADRWFVVGMLDVVPDDRMGNAAL